MEPNKKCTSSWEEDITLMEGSQTTRVRYNGEGDSCDRHHFTAHDTNCHLFGQEVKCIPPFAAAADTSLRGEVMARRDRGPW